MSTLALTRPYNLDTSFGDFVEHDVFMIADRIKDISRALFIVFNPDRDDDQKYAVIEKCDDGVDRLVFRTSVLDARIIEKLQYLLNVPFEKRFAEATRLEAKNEAEREEHERDQLFERVGAPMQGLLHRTGGIDHRRESYPTRSIKAS